MGMGVKVGDKQDGGMNRKVGGGSCSFTFEDMNFSFMLVIGISSAINIYH